MTPQDKAEEIFNQYANVIYDRALTVVQYEICKQCALITVDEMIKMYNEMNENGFLKPNSVGFILNDVKNEIEKL